MSGFSFARLLALLRKETIEIIRDSTTLRIIVAIPIIQLFLFGYAINSDPNICPPDCSRSWLQKFEDNYGRDA